MFKSTSIKNHRKSRVPPLNQLSRGRSKVWKSFMVSQDRTQVACLLCGDLLSYTPTQSTTGMWNHLKKKHSSVLQEPNDMDTYRIESFGQLQQTSPDPQQKTWNDPIDAKVEGDQNYSSQSHPDVEENLTSEFSEPGVKMKWLDYKDSFLGFFAKLYHEERYTDVTLVAENVFFKAHRFMLSSASEFFDEMFSFAPDSTHPIIHLKGTKAADLQMLLEFIYIGEVTIPSSVIQDLVRLGTELKVHGLQKFNETDLREGEEHNGSSTDCDQVRVEPSSAAGNLNQNQFSDGTEQQVISSDYTRASDFLEFTKPVEEEESEEFVADFRPGTSSLPRRRNRSVVGSFSSRLQALAASSSQSSNTLKSTAIPAAAPSKKARIDICSPRIESVSGSMLESPPEDETDPFRLYGQPENDSSSASSRPSCSWDTSQSACLSLRRFLNQDVLTASTVSSNPNEEALRTSAPDTDRSQINSGFPT